MNDTQARACVWTLGRIAATTAHMWRVGLPHERTLEV